MVHAPEFDSPLFTCTFVAGLAMAVVTSCVVHLRVLGELTEGGPCHDRHHRTRSVAVAAAPRGLVPSSRVALGGTPPGSSGPRSSRGRAIVTCGRQRVFVAGLLTLWFAADWPPTTSREQYLRPAHDPALPAGLAYIAPPRCFLLATPTWLARPSSARRIWRWTKVLAVPVVAGVIFNGSSSSPTGRRS